MSTTTVEKKFNRIQYLANGIIELVQDVTVTLPDGDVIEKTELHKIDEQTDLTTLTQDSKMVAQFALHAKAQYEQSQAPA